MYSFHRIKELLGQMFLIYSNEISVASALTVFIVLMILISKTAYSMVVKASSSPERSSVFYNYGSSQPQEDWRKRFSTSLCAGVSFIGGLLGGPEGLVIGVIVGILSALGYTKWKNGAIVLGSPSDALRFFKTHLIKIAIGCGLFSSICFAYAGRADIAVGGLIGEAAGFEITEWRNSFPIFHSIAEALGSVYSVHIRPLVDMIFASEIAKKVAIGISGAVCTLSAYSKVRWQNAYEKLKPLCERLLPLLKSRVFLISTVLILIGALVIFYRKQILDMLVRLNDWKNRNLMPRIQQFKNRSLELLNDTKVWLQTGHNVKHMAITAGAGFVTLALLWSATKYAPTESMTFFLKDNFAENGSNVNKFVKAQKFRMLAIVVIAVLTYLTFKHRDEIISRLRKLLDACEFRSKQFRNSLYEYIKTLPDAVREKIPSTIRKSSAQLLEKINLKCLQQQLEPFTCNLHVEKFMNMLKTSQGANNALICASLAILGYLFGDWPGLLIGVTSASLIVKYYPSIDSGSTVVGDSIMQGLGLDQMQTHQVNLLGSVYKLKLPKEDITTIQQWEEHKRSAIFKNFMSFMFDEMRFKVKEIHVKLEKNNDPGASRLTPLVSANASTDAMQSFDTPDFNEPNTSTNLPEQFTNQVPSKISMNL